MHRIVLALAVAGCSSPAKPAPQPPTLPASSTTCFAGLSSGMGQAARTIARRTVDPAHATITEDVSHDASGAHGAKSFHVVMTVDGDHFAMTEAGGAFTGSGTLAGEPWRWTSWSSVSQIPNAGIEVDSEDELTPGGMRATKQIKQGGKVLATTVDELKTFDCAAWDATVAAIAVPVLDDAQCTRACRNYATLKFWASAEQELASMSEADRAAAKARKQTELDGKLEAGLASCVSACLSSDNPVQTSCMVVATAVDQLAACN